MSRVLIVTADDFGYCGERNRGIVEAYKSGVITRSSLLVNASYAKEAAVLASEHQIPLGLHLNLTEGLPISPASDVPTLLDNDDQFFRGKNGFRSSLAEHGIDLQEVRVEIIAQIDRFRMLTGHLPFYVDGHQHVHILSGVRNVFAEVLEEVGVTSTRLPMEHGIDDCDWIPTTRRDFYKSVVKDAQQASIVFRNRNLRFGNGFVGMATMGRDMNPERLKQGLLTALSSNPPISHYAGGQNPMLNCDNMQTVKSAYWSPQPGAASPSHSGAALVLGSGSGELEDKKVEDPTPGKTINCDRMVTVKGEYNNNTGYPLMVGTECFNTVEVELMAHPGYPCVDPEGGCGEGPDEFALSGDRLHELKELKKPWFQTFLQGNSIRLGRDFVRGRLQL